MGVGSRTLSSLKIQKLDMEQRGTQQLYEDVTLYICTLNMKSMRKTQNRPENSFFCVKEGRESWRQTFSPSEMALREKPLTLEVWLNVITGGLFEVCV